MPTRVHRSRADPDSAPGRSASEHAAAGRRASGALGLEGNRLLAGLPAAEAEPLLASAERVRPRMRQEIHPQGATIDAVYFPQGGVFSLIAAMQDSDDGVEVLTIGNEGMLGLAVVLGATRSATQSICQIGGWALRVPAARLLEAAPIGGVLHGRLMRYAESQMTSLARSVACNRLHSAQQRYARWVLTIRDRVDTDEFPITQVFLAQMLGVTRPTVSQAGRELQAAGLIHAVQGRLTVDDRVGLEAVACECYATIRAAVDASLNDARV